MLDRLQPVWYIYIIMAITFHPEKIKEARLAAGLSQEQVARQLRPQMYREAVLRWEKGLSEPPAPRIGQLASILGVSVDFFYSDNDKKTDESTTTSI